MPISGLLGFVIYVIPHPVRQRQAFLCQQSLTGSCYLHLTQHTALTVAVAACLLFPRCPGTAMYGLCSAFWRYCEIGRLYINAVSSGIMRAVKRLVQYSDMGRVSSWFGRFLA